MKAVLFVLVVLLALIAAFAVQNAGIITVRFLHLTGETSLLVVVVAAFAAAAAVVGLIALVLLALVFSEPPLALPPWGAFPLALAFILAALVAFQWVQPWMVVILAFLTGRHA